MSPTRSIRALALGATLAALVLCGVAGWGSPAWWALPALAVGVAVSEVAVVHLQFGRQRYTLSLTDALVGAAWSLSVGAWTVVAVVAGVGIAQVVRHQPRLKLQFNVAMFAAATATGTLVADLAGGGPVGAICGMGAFFVLNHGLVSCAVAITSKRRVVPMLVTSAPLAVVHTAGNTSIGLLGAFLATEAPVGLLGLVVPLALLWSSYDQQTRRSQEVRLFAELAAGQERANGRSVDLSAQAVVTAAARLFGGADIEMLVLAADGPVRFAGDETGAPQRLRVDADVFDERWVMRALGARGVTTGVESGRPWCSALIGDPSAPLAVLIARRPNGSAVFGRRELQLAEVLVGQAVSWLSVADLSAQAREASEQVEVAGQAAKALGDLGAATAPALTVLRESANRLARLAETAGGVEDIVDELHLVERAVASLLGAVALAADPDLLTASTGTPLSPSRPATDWTTTGVLR